MAYTIEAKNIWKKYRLYHDRTPTLKERVLFRKRNSYQDLWVLKGIDLQIEKGKTVGLIGHNGSGKSTLLKLFTRIIYPDKGSINIKGKVSSLLELGAGFHPDFTGLENIYMNAAIFGMTKKEIENKLDDIIQFSELGDFINSPVRTYSSGMYMRLAFSIAINVEPEILLIDEILSVGDENFQKKCFNKMKAIKAEGVTIIIVSHDLTSIEKLCDEVVWLHNGHIQRQGVPVEVIAAYRNEMSEQENAAMQKQNTNQDGAEPTNRQESQRWGTKEIEIASAKMTDLAGNRRYSFACGEPCLVELNCQVNQKVTDLHFGVAFYGQDNLLCYGTNTAIDKFAVETSQIKNNITVKFKIDKLNLIEGEYHLDVAAHDEYGKAYDYQIKCLNFTTYSSIKDVGVCRIDHKWEIS